MSEFRLFSKLFTVLGCQWCEICECTCDVSYLTDELYDISLLPQMLNSSLILPLPSCLFATSSKSCWMQIEDVVCKITEHRCLVSHSFTCLWYLTIGLLMMTTCSFGILSSRESVELLYDWAIKTVMVDDRLDECKSSCNHYLQASNIR